MSIFLSSSDPCAGQKKSRLFMLSVLVGKPPQKKQIIFISEICWWKVPSNHSDFAFFAKNSGNSRQKKHLWSLKCNNFQVFAYFLFRSLPETISQKPLKSRPNDRNVHLPKHGIFRRHHLLWWSWWPRTLRAAAIKDGWRLGVKEMVIKNESLLVVHHSLLE